ncbi:MAG: hypothetical protein ACFFAX_16255 [Promethearchaeota archaeon]
MVERYGWKTIQAIGTIIVLFIVASGWNQCVAVGSWSDDFNDGDCDDWTVYGFDLTTGTAVPVDGEFSAENHTLAASGPMWSYAAHSSSVAFGSWRFRLHAMNTPDDYVIVFFCISDFSLILINGTGYSLSVCTGPVGTVTTGPALLLSKHEGRPFPPIIARYNSSDEISGWQDIHITRDYLGKFHVYLNGTLRIQAVDMTYVTSEDFCFGSESGPAIDDVNVIATEDPIPSIPWDPKTIVLVGTGGLVVAVIIAVYHFKIQKRRALGQE